MNLDEWREVGQMIKKVRLAIMNELPNHHKSSSTYSYLMRALKSIDVVKDKLDKVVFEQFPGQPTEELAKIFYGDE